MSKQVKRASRFVFDDPKEADSFLHEANLNPSVAYAQHPLIGDGSVYRIPNQVLVTWQLGCRISVFNALEKRANELGGYYEASRSNA